MINKWRVVCQYLIHTVTLIALLVIIGYLYSVPQLYHLFWSYSMAIHTAFSLLFVSVAMTLVNPYTGFASIFTGNLVGNLMARRLFFSMTLAILFVGYLRILSHRYHLVNVELGIALLTFAFIITSFILILLTSRLLNRFHLKNKLIQENFERVVELSPYALIASDKDGKITMVNNKTEKLFGYDREEIIGMSTSVLLPDRMQRDSEKRRRQFFKLPNVTSFGMDDEIVCVDKYGKEFPIEAVTTPIRNEKGFSLLAFVVDITERKRDEETIKNHLQELQHKNQELEQFNYIASHDLQEPLRTVLNSIHFLTDEFSENITDEIKEHLSIMAAAVSRMSILVQSLLTFGKLGRNKKLARVDTGTLIGNVLADLNSLIETRCALITVSGNMPVIYAYETELRQLFQNLINNAIKFTEKGKTPKINLTCVELPGAYEFSVTDNGIGIEPHHFERIFHIFQRLNKADEFEGHGIGLANCKKIAEMHGGKIWVEPAPDGGSKFLFTVLKIR